MTTDIVTKSSRFYCVSLTPDICKTPVGSSTPPLPYNVIGEFSEATAASPNVKARSKPVILHQRSTIPTVKGDEAGTTGGVKSGTVGKQVDTKSASKKHRANGVDLVQAGREVWMNSRNTIGKIFERGMEAARPTLSALAQEYKDKHSADAHEFGAYLIDKGGDAAGKGALTAASGAALTATGVLAPIGIPATAAGTTVAAGGGIAMAGGAALDGAATVLDQTADFVLTGETPGFLAAAEKYALTTGVSLAEGIAFRRLGGAGNWLKKWLDGKIGARLKKLTDKKAGKKPNADTPKPPPKGENEGKVKGAKKDKKNDAPSDCCPKDKGPANKSAKGRKPVHFGTGQEILHQTDFVIDAAIPIEWTRCYRSGAECEDWGPFGARWASAYTTSISLADCGIVYHDDSGRALRLPWLPPGQSHDSRKEGFVLERGHNGDFTLTWRDGSMDRFELAGTGVLPHGYDGVNMMLPPSSPLETQRYLLVSSGGRDRRGLKIEHMPNAKPSELMLRVTTDDGLCVEAIRDNTRPLASAKDAPASTARIGKVEQVMADGKRICHVTYAYEAESEAASSADTPFPSLPRRYNLVRQTNLLGDFRSYTYQHHLMTACTTYTGFTQTISWISLAALRARWSGTTVDEVQLSALHPITLANSYQARATATHAADNSEHVDIAYLDVNTTRVTDACGALDYFFDANWLITDVRRVINGVGRSLGKREWDDDGMLLAETTLAGTTRFVYDAAGNLIRSIDALGNKTSVDYDEHNQPVAVTDALGNVTRRTYDAAGRLATITDALGHTTTYKYDEHGWLVELVDAKGGAKRISYDSVGRVRTHTDCSGYTTSYRYDEQGRLAALADALEQETHYGYDAVGRLVCLTQPDQTRSLFEYDADDQLTNFIDANGNRTRYRYNGQGLPVERIDANGNSLHYRYDGSLRLIELINANNDIHRMSYTPEGDLASEKGFDGRVTVYQYDRTGQLSARECEGQRIEFSRDSLGRLQTKTSADGIVRFSYDAVGQLTAVYANQSEHLFFYDALGQLQQERVAYFLTNESTMKAPHVVRMSDASFAISHCYDELGDRIQTILPNGRRIDTLRYGSGNWHGLLWQGKPLVDVERDSLHRERGRQFGSIHTQLSATRTYDQQSQLKTAKLAFQFSNETVMNICERHFDYDPVGNVVKIECRRNKYGYFPEVFSYTYDALGQLLYAAQPNLREFFGFDKVGNLYNLGPSHADKTPDGAAGHRKADQITAASHALNKIAYDENSLYDRYGNLILKKSDPTNAAKAEEISFSYDAENRLIQFEKSNTTSHCLAHYFYDAFGRRIGKQVIENQVAKDIGRQLSRGKICTSLFVWDGDAMVQELMETGITTYIYEPDTLIPLAQIVCDMDNRSALEFIFMETTPKKSTKNYSQHTPDNTQKKASANISLQLQVSASPNEIIKYYNCDQIGTPRELVGGNGQLLWVSRAKVWGQEIRGNQMGADNMAYQPIRFQGQYEDTETGLFYNRYRYYSPPYARYITADPTGLSGGPNSFAYAPNPLGWVDQLGLRKCSYNPSCDPCYGKNPAAWASQWQGHGAYRGRDVWTNTVLKKGTIIYGGAPGQSGFYFDQTTLYGARGDKANLWMSLQVLPNRNFGYRRQVQPYRVKKDTCVAVGIATSQTSTPNRNFGKGGGAQYFLSDFKEKLVADGGRIILR